MAIKEKPYLRRRSGVSFSGEREREWPKFGQSRSQLTWKLSASSITRDMRTKYTHAHTAFVTLACAHTRRMCVFACLQLFKLFTFSVACISLMHAKFHQCVRACIYIYKQCTCTRTICIYRRLSLLAVWRPSFPPPPRQNPLGIDCYKGTRTIRQDKASLQLAELAPGI